MLKTESRAPGFHAKFPLPGFGTDHSEITHAILGSLIWGVTSFGIWGAKQI